MDLCLPVIKILLLISISIILKLHCSYHHPSNSDVSIALLPFRIEEIRSEFKGKFQLHLVRVFLAQVTLIVLLSMFSFLQSKIALSSRTQWNSQLIVITFVTQKIVSSLEKSINLIKLLRQSYDPELEILIKIGNNLFHWT